MLKFALVGCGRISKRHSDLLGNNEINGATLSAVCDIDKSKADVLAKKYGVSAYTDMHLMARNEDIDVIVILTESGNHARHVLELAKYGKHIVVEKPMALTINDADTVSYTHLTLPTICSV